MQGSWNSLSPLFHIATERTVGSVLNFHSMQGPSVKLQAREEQDDESSRDGEAAEIVPAEETASLEDGSEVEVEEDGEGEPRPHDGSKPSIYQYVDYRAFLKDRFRWAQSQDATFSQRKLARVAGFANPGFFNEVI